MPGINLPFLFINRNERLLSLTAQDLPYSILKLFVPYSYGIYPFLYSFTLWGHYGVNKDINRDNSYSLENKEQVISYMLPTGDTIQILAVAVAWAELCLYFSLLAPHLILWLLRTIKLMAAAAAPGEGWREPSKGEGT